MEILARTASSMRLPLLRRGRGDRLRPLTVVAVLGPER